MTISVNLIHSDQPGGNGTLWKSTIHSTVVYTAVAGIAAGDFRDEVTGTTTAMLGFAQSGTLALTAGFAGALSDGLGGSTSAVAGAASHTAQYGVSFLCGAEYLSINYTAAVTSGGTKIGFVVVLSE